MLRKHWLVGTLSDERFAAAIEGLGDLELDRYPALPLIRRAYELRANVIGIRCPIRLLSSEQS